jgi:Zn-finger nucleic acid-binding protein
MRCEVVERVAADICARHGIWLDKDELRKIIESIKGAEMRNAQRVIRSRDLSNIAEQAMTEGILGRWRNRF